ncbi:hypothetical protein QR680_010482 [Steinernema hermaphroditum]|uniref:Uncharacterized protein n=1 Tax=Steinernema hermaphroditum TaxID=289476 RepID=A0AA39IP62_9BILA|nr:hypothetical protein QR680_010482 [Steinernema hermaphroditum]
MLSDEASSSMLPNGRGSSGRNANASVYYKIASAGDRPRSSGGVVVDDCTQFSLEEDEDVPVVIPLEERLHDPRNRHSQHEPLIEYRLESDDEDNGKDKHRTPARVTSKRNGATNGKELSRLTDEFEVDGDSASDELDLIPPMPSSGSSSSKRFKMPSKLLCCSSRVPLKCAIM